MKNQFLLCLTLLTACSIRVSWGQQLLASNSQKTTTISADQARGKITDAGGAAMPGVSVVVKGSSRGTVTNPEGRYSIDIRVGETLVFSFVGYQTQEIKVGSDLSINVSMSEDSKFLTEVTVIGSRAATARTNIETAAPVDVITTKELKGFSQVDIGQILNYVAPSFSSNRQTVSDGTDHIDPASLRGLGPDQVLVLVNGKRRHTTALVNINGTVGRGSVGTDMNVIPVAAVERIEVLRDGAAAQYGSDAIAGVINVVLKKNYDGLSASLTGGANMTTLNYAAPNITGGTNKYSEKITDGEVVQFDFSKGLRLGKGGVTISGQYNQRGRTNRSGLDNAPTIYLGTSGGFPATPTGQDVNTFRKGLIAADAAYASQQGYDRQNMVFGNSNSKNLGLFLNGGLPVGKASEVYFSAGVTHRTGTGYGNNRIPVSRAQQPLAADGSLYYPNGFLPGIGSAINDESVLVGFKTKLGEWRMDLSNTFGANAFTFSVFNSGNASLPNSSSIQTEFDAGTLKFDQNTTNLDFSRMYSKVGAITGLNVAFGAELRRDHYQIQAGELNSYTGADLKKTVPGAPLVVGGPANGTTLVYPVHRYFRAFSQATKSTKRVQT
ncbi:TonB-dependent receptor plug domain-containing protein [Runella sp.]|uniref:TonB-dependent receptor n=1 Tax=Runella sp. TaxID=1960881 RepID=UPI00262D5F81|nr:TonB-dependent receptor plug domain-containing protein [Runella sp.]